MNRYQILVAYDDYFSKDEVAPNLPCALSALSIYLDDPHATMARIYDFKTNEFILKWAR